VNQQRDLTRTTTTHSTITTHDNDLAPGHSSRSSELGAPLNPIASGLILRKARDANGVAEGADHAVAAATSSGGQQLPASLLDKFESSLGADLSSVRVHTGNESAHAAHAVGARAYTLGQDIHFGAGQFQPDTETGQHLIAHEVAHTVQQAGSSARAQYKLEVSAPGDALETEADHAASAMVSGRPAAVTHSSGIARKIHRKDFGGFAGTAEARAGTTAAAAASGLNPVNITTDYALSRADSFAKKMDAFEQGNIPGYYDDHKKHVLYPILSSIREGYLGDVHRIPVAEAAFNTFVKPASFANKEMIKFRAMQQQLGFSDDLNPAGDLSETQKGALGKAIDKDKVATLKNAVSAEQQTTTGLRTQLLGSLVQSKAAAAGHIAILETEKAKAKDEEKQAIEEKIKNAQEVAAALVKVVEVGAAAASGGATEFAASGSSGKALLEGGKEIGKASTGLIETGVGAAMERYYKDDLDKLKSAIRNATQAASVAGKLDTDLRIEGEMITAKGLTEQLAGATGRWVAAMKALREYYIEAAAAAEKASGGKAGGAISQLMSYVSAASEVKPHLSAGKSTADTAVGTMSSQVAAMTPHRNVTYGTIEDASYGATKIEGNGPDVNQINGCIETVKTWQTQAGKDESILNRVEGSVGV